MTAGELRAQLATVPDEHEVLVVVNSGTPQLYDLDAVGDPHEGVTTALVGSLLEHVPLVVLYVS